MKISRNFTKNELYKSEKDNILKVCSKQQHERKNREFTMTGFATMIELTKNNSKA